LLHATLVSHSVDVTKAAVVLHLSADVKLTFIYEGINYIKNLN